MNTLSCRQIENGIDDFLGGTLSERDQIRYDMHLGTCPKCRESIAMWRGFTRSMSEQELDPYPPLVERRMVIAAVAERGPEQKTRQTNWKIWTSLSAAAATVAVVALLITLTVDPLTIVPRTGQTESSLAEKTTAGFDDANDLSVTTMGDGRQAIAVTPGTNLWLDKDAKVFVETVRQNTVRFRLEEGRVVAEVTAPVKGYRFIVATPNGEVEAKGTVFSVEVRAKGVEKARVMRGVIEVRQTNGAERGVLRSVTLQAGEESRVGDTEPRMAKTVDLALDMCLVTACTETEVAALERDAAAGNVTGEDPYETEGSLGDGDKDDTSGLFFVIANKSGDDPKEAAAKRQRIGSKKSQELDSDGRGSIASVHGAQIQEIVSLALAKRRAGLYPMAADAYHRLIREFPASAEARNALVSLGQLELVELGKPSSAVEHFQEYLKSSPKGFLAEEARLGMVRAASRLGQSKEVIEQASEYLYQHPGGYAGAEVLRLRGDAKRKMGDCKGAVQDYLQLKNWWPESRQNKHGQNGLAACGHPSP